MADDAVPFINIRAKDYHISDDLARELASIVIEWSTFENAITIDLEQLWQFAKAKKLADSIPGAFGARLKLWNRVYHALFPAIPLYTTRSDAIASKGREVALIRHRLIHGLWRPADEPEGAFHVIAGLDRRKDIKFLLADAALVGSLHKDIKTLSNAVWSLNVTRMMHAAQGLLQAVPAPSAEHPAPQAPPSGEKP
jgi:hypothetical protein